MPRFDIDKARTRNSLAVRREPYWGAPLARGLFLGYRKLDQGGTWIARQRDEEGRQRYHSIGHADSIAYADAVKAAHDWANALDAGLDMSEVQTVADACREYVKDRRREIGKANAEDADGRFRRTIYGHSIGKVKLSKLRTAQIKHWRASLEMSDASKNRTFAALKAALNFAVTSRYVEAGRAIEWQSVKRLQVTSRRDLYLDRDQRRALLANIPDEAHDFVRLLTLLPVRPGALAAANAGDLDIKQGTLRIRSDKAGAGRIIALSPEALSILKHQARLKLPSAPLVAYSDGTEWNKDRWKKPIQLAAVAADLPQDVCAYTLRHSVITDMLTGGMDSLTVARMAGTSLAMLEKHYGHLLLSHAAQAMAALPL